MKYGMIAGLILSASLGTQAFAQNVTIGVIAPTTGPIATVGTRQLQSLQYWAETANKAGGVKGKQVEIAHCNDEGSPEKAVNCARDLISRGVALLINCSVTGPILATMPLVVNGPVMLTPSPNVIPAASTYVFQTSPSDRSQTQALADFLKSGGVKKIGMVAATDSSGEIGVRSAQEVYPASGIDLNLARIDLRATDASIQLAKVAQADVKVIYSSYSGAGAASVVKSYNNLGLELPLVISYANISDAFTNLVKDEMPKRLLGTALKSVAPALLTPEERAAYEAFEKGFKAWRGQQVDMLTLTGAMLADTAQAIIANVADPKDPKAVKTFLETTPIKSIQTLKFSPEDHVGLGKDGVAIVEFKNGVWVEAAGIK